jgi:hypothetical protein
MPLIVIHNVGQDLRLMTTNFVEGLKKTVEEIPELHIAGADVTVSYNPGMADQNDQTVIVIVELLFDKPERTFEVRQRLAEQIGTYILEGLKRHGRARKVEVAVKKFNPEKDAFVVLE